MEISKKDKKYLVASAILVLIAISSIAVFAAQEVRKSKNGIGKISAKSGEIIPNDEDFEVLEMERLNSFSKQSKQREEVVVVSNRSDAEQVMREMDGIMGSIEKEISDGARTEGAMGF